MKIISPANQTVMAILGKAREGTDYRMLHFCVEEAVNEGVLLFNLLTKELLLLTQEEYENRLELDALKQRWFVVPAETKDKEYASTVRWVHQMRAKKTGTINGYTIFTTTDCNARCYYCFELGWNRIHMTEDTAKQTLAYIKKHCGGKKVHLAWFGGEPLYNMKPIDIICQGLQEAGIEYSSTMVSNGYLLNAQTVEKAVNSWKLQKVQISLDGTEDVYNKIKAYIYDNVNAFEEVMKNIGLALQANIKVQIRLNMDLSNHKDLMELVDQLALRFEGMAGLSVYASHLFKNGVASADLYTCEEWMQRETAMEQLEQRIARHHLADKRGIKPIVRLTHCMADDDNCMVVSSSGHLGRCEHCHEEDYIGHVADGVIDTAKAATWKELVPEIPECAQCFYYPYCILLKRCSTSNVCFQQNRDIKKRKLRLSMVNEYEKWLNQQK